MCRTWIPPKATPTLFSKPTVPPRPFDFSACYMHATLPQTSCTFVVHHKVLPNKCAAHGSPPKATPTLFSKPTVPPRPFDFSACYMHATLPQTSCTFVVHHKVLPNKCAAHGSPPRPRSQSPPFHPGPLIFPHATCMQPCPKQVAPLLYIIKCFPPVQHAICSQRSPLHPSPLIFLVCYMACMFSGCALPKNLHKTRER